MTSIKVLKENEKIVNVTINGHTNYDDYGKDIVCASVSTIATTTINAIIRINDKAIDYEVKDGFLNIKILLHDEYIDTLLENMIDLFKTLSKDYPKNVKINI